MRGLVKCFDMTIETDARFFKWVDWYEVSNNQSMHIYLVTVQNLSGVKKGNKNSYVLHESCTGPFVQVQLK